MNRFTALALAVLPCLFSCSSNGIYRPASKPERLEYARDILDVYPGDIRRNPDLYTNIGVGWAGVIQSARATNGPDGLIHAVTTFEQRYFDWEQDSHWGGARLSVSPRGEGLFRTEIVLRRAAPDADLASAEQFASPGSLAIVYGVPEAVEDGVVILKYRYLRVIPPDQYSISRFDYGRFGEPVRYLGNPPPAPKP
ncbi:MAG: hypothetical protein ABSA47_15105 [Verrucomicrobiota bacterium]|jgi:hypothetical protein